MHSEANTMFLIKISGGTSFQSLLKLYFSYISYTEMQNWIDLKQFIKVWLLAGKGYM